VGQNKYSFSLGQRLAKTLKMNRLLSKSFGENEYLFFSPLTIAQKLAF
jgi:hypothetical protein